MSDNGNIISFNIKPTWSVIKKIQEDTLNYMNSKGTSKNITEATMMCVAELTENAIKYGVETPNGETIQVGLKFVNNKITITVSNGVNSEKDLNNIKTHINKIHESDNPADLYTQRLKELMEDSKQLISQLGLFRIAYEGQFALKYNFCDGKLTVIAEREIQSFE